MQEGGQRRRDAAQEIAAASLVAAVEIYSSMEAAAQMVLESGSQAASDIAGHKYGVLIHKDLLQSTGCLETDCTSFNTQAFCVCPSASRMLCSIADFSGHGCKPEKHAVQISYSFIWNAGMGQMQLRWLRTPQRWRLHQPQRPCGCARAA